MDRLSCEGFKPIEMKKGADVFFLSCGHYCQCIICNRCPICSEKIEILEKKHIPKTKSYLCWDCQKWIGDIQANKSSIGLECHNCASINLIKNNDNKRKPIDSILRHECFKRDNYKCVECGNSNKESILHADHILPVSQGGTDELSNLQTLCEGCNLAKSNKKWEKKENCDGGCR